MNNDGATNFQRKIGLSSGICFVVGIIIGSGIFVSPKGVFENVNCDYTWTAVVWLASGFHSMLGALVYSELGTTIVRSGGDYAYLKAGFGSFVSFLYLWINLWVIRPAGQAILALATATYLLEPFKSSCQSWDFDALTRTISILLVILLGYVNSVDVKGAIKLQNVFTILKVLALAIIISTGIGFYATGRVPPGFIESNSEVLGASCKSQWSLSLYAGLFAFGGWNYLNIVTDELKDPYKNLPRAALVGILLTTLIYILTNVAYFLTLTPAEILNSPAIALTFASKVLGQLYLLPVSLAISASAIGSLNANIFTSSRLFCMGAQEGHLPAVLGMLHVEHYTPVASLLLSVLLTLLMFLTPNIYTLINYFSFTYWLWTGITVAAGISLRHRRPALERPICLPLWVLYLFTFLNFALTILAAKDDLLSSAIGVAFVLVGIPVYLAKEWTQGKMGGLNTFIDKVNLSIQKIFLIVETTAPEMAKL